MKRVQNKLQFTTIHDGFLVQRWYTPWKIEIICVNAIPILGVSGVIALNALYRSHMNTITGVFIMNGGWHSRVFLTSGNFCLNSFIYCAMREPISLKRHSDARTSSKFLESQSSTEKWACFCHHKHFSHLTKSTNVFIFSIIIAGALHIHLEICHRFYAINNIYHIISAIIF